MRTRMPFRYGIATMTATPHLFLKIDLEIDGKVISGLSADNLPPKWFTKNPESSTRDDVREMLEVIEFACRHAGEVGEAASVFELWRAIYSKQKAWAQTKYPPLLWGFGVSIVERAIIDAFCRARGMTFGGAVRTNALGMNLESIHPQLAASTPADWLPAQPATTVIARHTVGLSDPLTDAEIALDDRAGDGLPQSLESCIDAYGLTHFKIKLLGDVTKDLQRLRRLSENITRQTRGSFSFTLDGNENFNALAPFRALWEELLADSSLREFMTRLIFVEQPLHRDVALSDAVRAEIQAWSTRPPMIIDESDATLDSLRIALECGYSGSSHKNCKGIFKGIANACLISKLRRDGKSVILSCEDLSNVGPIALLQDLAVVATLGIEHCERNGHHYFKGLSALPVELQQTVAREHPDLYVFEQGFSRVLIKGGIMSTASAAAAPFGRDFEMDAALFTPVKKWNFDSL